MNFNVVAIATAVVGALLGTGWLLFGHRLLGRWAVAPSPGALLVGRRLGAVYLGIALMLALGRNAPASDLRFAICVGLLFALGAVAILGLVEFMGRRASAGILASAAIEAVLAGGFAWVAMTHA